MWLVNMNCLGVLREKLAGGQRLNNCKKSQFSEGYPWGGGGGDGCVTFF